MPPDRSFQRHIVIVALAHVVLVVGLYLFSMFGKRPEVPQVLWLDGGSIGGGDITGEAAPAPEPAAPEPEPEPPPPPKREEPKPEIPPPPPPEPVAPSEIVTPQATPVPTPLPATPTPTPKPATPKPETPKPATPKPTPKKTTPKPTPKPSTPKSTPRKSTAATPKAKSSSSAEKPKSTPAGGKTEGSSAARSGAAATGGNGPGTGNGKGPGKAGSGSGASEFGWYFAMIHDRFHNRWEQPTSIIRGAQDFVTTLKLRISKDGTILGREIVRSSGDTIMDQSVMAAAEHVQQIDPLPAGLGDGSVFEVNVAFKLDQGL